MIIINKFL